jgi:hypothetical protein
MAFPTPSSVYGAWRVRTLQAQTTTSGVGPTQVTIPFRCRYLFSVAAPSGLSGAGPSGGPLNGQKHVLLPLRAILRFV